MKLHRPSAGRLRLKVELGDKPHDMLWEFLCRIVEKKIVTEPTALQHRQNFL